MTREQLLSLACRLETESGFMSLSVDQSWHAEQTLGAVRYSMHRVAAEMFNLIELINEQGLPT